MSHTVKPLSPDRLVLKTDLVERLIKLQRQLTQEGFPEISARKVISAALPVANNSVNIHERVAASRLFRPGATIGQDGLIPMELFELKPNQFKKGMMKNPLREAVNEWWSYIQEELDWFRDALQLIIDNPDRARSEYAEPIGEMLKDLCVIPQLQWNGTAIDTKLHFTSLKENHTCIFVMMLLLDEKERLYRSLRICKLPECQRFFLLGDNRPGPRNAYCSEEHRPDSAERMRRLRAKRARKPK